MPCNYPKLLLFSLFFFFFFFFFSFPFYFILIYWFVFPFLLKWCLHSCKYIQPKVFGTMFSSSFRIPIGLCYLFFDVDFVSFFDVVVRLFLCFGYCCSWLSCELVDYKLRCARINRGVYGCKMITYVR